MAALYVIAVCLVVAIALPGLGAFSSRARRERHRRRSAEDIARALSGEMP
jgi:hypothetical protein